MTIAQREAEPRLSPPSKMVADYIGRSISVSYLLKLVLAGRYLIVATTILGLLYGLYTAHQNGPVYTATIQVSPAESDSGVGDLASAGGLLAGLAGAGTVAVPKFTLFLSAIGSIGVAHDLNRKYDLLCRIYKGDCDPVTHQWKERSGLREWFNAQLARLGKLPNPNGPRTEKDLAAYLRSAVTIETNKNNSMVSLHYSNTYPDVAAQRLAVVIKAANDYIRAQSNETQKRYVEYLTQSAAKATNVEQRQAIDNLLLQEERQLMMTEVDIPYAAKILDGPIVEPVNTVLKTLLLCTFNGLLIGIAMALSRDLLPRRWRFW